jgi:hypothetical protein
LRFSWRRTLYLRQYPDSESADSHARLTAMATDQYHEPPEELSDKTRTLARVLTGLIEECEAINWYQQRISVEKDKQAKAIMKNAQKEEFKHFGMGLEFVMRQLPDFRDTLKEILFKPGEIVEHGGEAEDAVD